MPRLPTISQEDAARLDFVEGVRLHNYTSNIPAVLDHYRQATQGMAEVPATWRDAGAAIVEDSTYRFAAGIQRHAQVMGWAAAIESLRSHTDELRDTVMSEPTDPVGSLELDPELPLPSWYTYHDELDRDDIHLVPGGYFGDLLVGPVYERGGALYRMAWRNGYTDSPPGSLIAFARGAPAPSYDRILDLGCAFGGNTMAYRAAYPEASQVVGIDISEPALRWAHLTAEERGVDITFAQRDAAATGFPDASFDLVTSFLLLHEVPPGVLDQIVAEAYRVVRPGGHVRFLDIPPYEALDPEVGFVQSFDHTGNGEVFWTGFLDRDFKQLLSDAGFVDVEDHALDYEDPGYWGSAALMRDGTFRSANRWVTSGNKPKAQW